MSGLVIVVSAVMSSFLASAMYSTLKPLLTENAPIPTGLDMELVTYYPISRGIGSKPNPGKGVSVSILAEVESIDGNRYFHSTVSEPQNELLRLNTHPSVWVGWRERGKIIGTADDFSVTLSDDNNEVVFKVSQKNEAH